MTKNGSNFIPFIIGLSNTNYTSEEVKDLGELNINNSSLNDAQLPIKSKKGTKLSVDEMIPIKLDDYLVNTLKFAAKLRVEGRYDSFLLY